MASEPEEKAITGMMMAACVTGLVFILKANFMPGASGEGGKEKWARGRLYVKVFA